jgi:hypothetical protein
MDKLPVIRKEIQQIHPSGMKEATYFVYAPEKKKGMIRLEEVQQYFSNANKDTPHIEAYLRDVATKQHAKILHISNISHPEWIPHIQQWCHKFCTKPFVNLNSVLFEGFISLHNDIITGVIILAPFRKNDYPPPIRPDHCLDKADPVFYMTEDILVTDRIYRGYDMTLLCNNEHYKKLLLAHALLQIRKYHGRAVITANPLCETTKAFGFCVVSARFSLLYGGGPWQTQQEETDPITQPCFIAKLTTNSKEMISLDSVQKILESNKILIQIKKKQT